MTDKKKTPPTTKIEPITRELLCILTDAEVNDCARRAAFKDQKYDEVVIEYEQVKKAWKEKLDILVKDRKKLQSEAREGKTMRNVPCEVHFVYDAKPNARVDVIRLDTGEVFETRSMSDGEKQQHFPFEEPDMDDELGGNEDDEKDDDERPD